MVGQLSLAAEVISATDLSKLLFIASIVVLTGAMMFLSGVRLSFFKVQPEGRDFVISWQVDVEEQVREYALARKTPYSNDQFVRIFTIPAHGTGKAYTFRDRQVYKSGSEKLDYRLEVVYTNGVREVITSQSVNYTSTAVRRTWGSLKAMFQ